jgi:hypothetical protein
MATGGPPGSDPLHSADVGDALFELVEAECERLVESTASFGDHLIVPETVVGAEWIAAARRGAWWTVGALVPNELQQIVRGAPDSDIEDWWSVYREVFEIVASIGQRYTSTPDRAWFAVWDGHGFAGAGRRTAWQGPLDDKTRSVLDDAPERLRVEDDRRNQAIGLALRAVPRSELPGRTYYLLTGAVMAVTEPRYPGISRGWRNPDLFWPDDRRWFVATAADVWSLYIGGDVDFVSEVAFSRDRRRSCRRRCAGVGGIPRPPVLGRAMPPRSVGAAAAACREA